MSRSDRQLSIIQMLRRRKVMTAALLAERLEVSERTIYRDVHDLLLSGTPIDGEPGVGYVLRSGHDLPPLMFDEHEIEALVLGARVVKSSADAALAHASDSALSKLESVLPGRLENEISRTRSGRPDLRSGMELPDGLALVRQAIAEQRKLELTYRRQGGERSRRRVRPLGAFFWGSTWTLTAWCELRKDFRNFRAYRIQKIELLDVAFKSEPGRRLEDYLESWGDAGRKLLEE